MTTTLSTKLCRICASLLLVTAISGCASFDKRQSEGKDPKDTSVGNLEPGEIPPGGGELDFDKDESTPSSNQSSNVKSTNNVDKAFADVEAHSNAPAPADNTTSGSGGEGDNSVTDIRYVSKKSGGTVVVETANPATFRTREVPARNQVVIEVANARLPERLKRPYNMQDFGQKIEAVNAYQDAGSSTARVVIQFKKPTHASVTQQGRELLVLGGRSTGSDNDSETVASSDESASSENPASDPRILPESSSALGVNPKFYGKPISIEVRDTPVRDVINLLGEQSGANIILSNDVQGNITLKLKQIPWDQALMIVMNSSGLGYVRQGTVLRIASQTTLQNESALAQKVLETQRASEPLKVKIVPVSYSPVSDVVNQITPFLTLGRGKVTADSRTSSVIITDTVENLERVSRLIKTLDVPPLQVLIEGKIVEAAENFSRSWGIKWGLAGQQIPLGGNLSLSQNNLSIAPTNAPSGNLFYNFRLGTLDVFGDLEASLGLAEQENIAKVVSAPRIVVMNNQSATIQQDRNVYYKQTTPSSNPSIAPTVMWASVKAQLNLAVTPQVTSGADIILDIALNRSFLGSANGDAPPDVNDRSAKTKVMVRNGQTAVIGGIYNADASQTEAGVPYLRNLPVVGWLFKTHETASTKNELLVFLTPRIINAEKSVPKEGTVE